MWYPAALTAAPESEPVSLTEAKAQTHVESSDDDTYLNVLISAARAHVESVCGIAVISAARAHVESVCGIAVITQTRTAKCDSFDDFALIPLAPIASVSSITYVDTAGATQTLATSVYEVRADGLSASIALKSSQSWPTIQTGSRITVTVVCGAATAPDEIKQAMLLIIAHWFMNREAVGRNDVAPMPLAVDALLANWRRYAF